MRAARSVASSTILRQEIEERGFAVIRDVFTASESEAAIAELEAAPLERSRAGARHLLKVPAVAALASDPRLLTLATSVLGSDALPYRATLFDKSPEANWLVAWHQDTALPVRERRAVPGWGPWSVKSGVVYVHAPAAALEKVVAMRIHLDDSDPSNGPLRVLPETHGLGVLSDSAIARLASEIEAVECVARIGGVTAMRPLIIHASSKSQSGAARRVLHIEYATSLNVGEGLELAVA